MPTKSKAILLLAGGLLIITQPGASCLSDTASDGGTTSRNEPYPGSDREEDPNYIPQRADIVREGRGALKYTADADGTIYVQNLRREETQLTRRVHRGEVIEVLPDENRIRIEQETVSKTDLKRDDAHRIYLLRDSRFEDDRDRDRADRNDRDRDRADPDDRTTVRAPIPRGVPASAQLMGEGKNKEISFRPSRRGSVYIYSHEDRRVVSRLQIQDGEKFVLSPGRSRATLDGKTVEQSVFDTTTTYRVYFNRED